MGLDCVQVYGAKADEFLSGALSQAAGFETELDAGFPSSSSFSATASPLSRRRMSAVQIMKSRLQNSRFVYGCVNTWANSSSGTALDSVGADDAERASEQDGVNSNPDESKQAAVSFGELGGVGG